MKSIRNPHRHVVADDLREAVIIHAYSADMDNSVIDGIRHVSDLWLLARRHQSLDDIMREVKGHESDSDICRITNDLQHSPQEAINARVSSREHALEPELDWMMV